jgi:hypothetical protein
MGDGQRVRWRDGWLSYANAHPEEVAQTSLKEYQCSESVEAQIWQGETGDCSSTVIHVGSNHTQVRWKSRELGTMSHRRTDRERQTGLLFNARSTPSPFGTYR